jgi:predicted lipid-binding transport protein (Tim44 family)
MALALTLASGPAAMAQAFYYPTQGQSQAQLDQDKGECHVWAVQQSGFDPANPAPPPTQTAATGTGPGIVGGAAGGAALGAVGGAIAGGKAGKGAAIGAATGGLLGGMVRSSRKSDHAQQEQQTRSSYDAQMAGLRDGYNRAVAACMQGRGYTVS